MNKEKVSWIMYDWANSAYSIIIGTAIFAIYFKGITTKGLVMDYNISEELAKNYSTQLWAVLSSLSTLIIALLAPIIGAISDLKGMKKKIFTIFFLIGTISTAALGIINHDHYLFISIIYIITVIGFFGANIIYDGFLVDICAEKERDKISSLGFSLGYFGSLIPFVFSIFLISQSDNLGISVITLSKISFLITALWWGLFTIPFLKNIHQKYGVVRNKEEKLLKQTFKTLGATLKNLKSYKSAFVFLLAYFFYIDGVDTVIKMATPIGIDLNIKETTLLLVLVLTQVVAFPCALIYGYVATKIGTFKVLIFGISTYIVLTLFAVFFMNTTGDFFFMGIMIGSAQGGIQALSRSEFSRRIPKEHANEFFGFYNIFGKFAAIIGPLIIALMLKITGSSTTAIAGLLLLFIPGLILTIKSKEIKD